MIQARWRRTVIGIRVLVRIDDHIECRVDRREVFNARNTGYIDGRRAVESADMVGQQVLPYNLTEPSIRSSGVLDDEVGKGQHVAM